MKQNRSVLVRLEVSAQEQEHIEVAKMSELDAPQLHTSREMISVALLHASHLSDLKQLFSLRCNGRTL